MSQQVGWATSLPTGSPGKVGEVVGRAGSTRRVTNRSQRHVFCARFCALTKEQADFCVELFGKVLACPGLVSWAAWFQHGHPLARFA